MLPKLTDAEIACAALPCAAEQKKDVPQEWQECPLEEQAKFFLSIVAENKVHKIPLTPEKRAKAEFFIQHHLAEHLDQIKKRKEQDRIQARMDLRLGRNPNTDPYLLTINKKLETADLVFICKELLQINPAPILLNEQNLDALFVAGLKDTVYLYDINEEGVKDERFNHQTFNFVFDHFKEEMIQFFQQNRRKIFDLLKQSLSISTVIYYSYNAYDVRIKVNPYLGIIIAHFKIDPLECGLDVQGDHKELDKIYLERIRAILAFVKNNKPKEFYGDKIENIVYGFSPAFKNLLDKLNLILVAKDEEDKRSVYQKYREVILLAKQFHQIPPSKADPFEIDFCAALINVNDKLPLTQHLYPCLRPPVQAETKAAPAEQKEVTVTRFVQGFAPCLFAPDDSFLGTPEIFVKEKHSDKGPKRRTILEM